MNIKKNWYVILIGLATVILGAIAVMTALRLYQAGKNPVAPNAPESKPAAQTLPTATPTPTNPCLLTFNLNIPTGTLTPTPTKNPSVTPTPTTNPSVTPTVTSTITPTPTPLASCYHTCTNDNDCEGTLTCQTVAGSKKCVKTQCPDELDCLCPVTQNITPTPRPVVTTTPEETLPDAGTDLPTLGLFAGGLILILIPLLLAF